ncbi:MAG: hypothetical protein ACTSWN_15575 [Promethearchaeota archaeon]
MKAKNIKDAKEGIEALIPKSLLRNVPGWKNAPVPACYGGDPRSLTFCCHPDYPLTFHFKCRRDALLKLVGLEKKEFVRIKDEFSKEHDWDGDVCFKSLSYCCMRAGGCPGNRDRVLKQKYPGRSWEQVLKIYFSLKKELANKILKACKNKDVVRPFIKE